MNDIFLFRGKFLHDNPSENLYEGDWVIGSLFAGAPSIIKLSLTTIPFSFTQFMVEKQTIGRCTGLKDKNGALIFEGDIVRTNSGDYIVKSKKGINVLYVVSDTDNSEWDELLEFHESRYTDYGNKEIIGNIHDNPDLVNGNG